MTGQRSITDLLSVLIRYSVNSKAFRCWNKQTGHIIVSRNVEAKDVNSHPLHPEHPTPSNNSEDDDSEHPTPSAHQDEPCTLTPKTDVHPLKTRLLDLPRVYHGFVKHRGV